MTVRAGLEFRLLQELQFDITGGFGAEMGKKKIVRVRCSTQSDVNLLDLLIFRNSFPLVTLYTLLGLQPASVCIFAELFL